MKATGVIRRIDDLGRIVIPKEIRRTLMINEGDPLELFVSGDVISLRKYVSSEDYVILLNNLMTCISEDNAVKNKQEIANRIKELVSIIQGGVSTMNVKNTILQFAFETGDTDCPYYQIFTVVQSGEDIDYGIIEDSLSSYIEQPDHEDKEFESIVEDVLNASGLLWSFISNPIPESYAIHTFWI